MMLKCLGCGHEFKGQEGDMCPRDVGNGKTCACFCDIIQADKPVRAGRKTTVVMTEGESNGSN